MFSIAKSKYDSHVKPRFEEIKAWRQSGESERNIAKKLGVSWQSFNVYKNQHSDFLDLLRHSKTKLVNNLKTALWKEAMGFENTEKKAEIEKVPVLNPNYDSSEPISELNQMYIYKNKIKTGRIKKYNRSQANLLMFALCNLCPEEFKRVDKDAVNQLEEELKERQNIITDTKIKDAFDKLYSTKKETKKDDKNEETKTTEDT